MQASTMMGAPPMQQPGQMVGNPAPPGHPGPPNTAAQHQQAQDQKLDNISKVKCLVGPLKESLANVLKTSAQNFLYNYNIDASTLKGGDSTTPNRFDKSLEEFFSICDQMELHLRTAAKCIQQGQSSQRYLPLPVLCRPENPAIQDSLSYGQYMSTVKSQVAFAKEIHDSLLETAQGIAPGE